MQCVICSHREGQVEILNDFKENQIHTNASLLNKIDKLEEKISAVSVANQINISSHNERIHKLEEEFSEKHTEPLCSGAFNNEKKKGLNFIEAINLCVKGKKLRRKSKNISEFLYLKDGQLGCRIPFFCLPGIYESANPDSEDITANDWEVVE